MKSLLASTAVGVVLLASTLYAQDFEQTMPRSALRSLAPRPRTYLVRHLAPNERVTLDGTLSDTAWAKAPWSEPFTDIEGAIRPAPRLRTRMKMLYDDSLWYIAAELSEPDLWATITQRDAVIFHDNDFELFVNPDGSTHRYFELEVNALGTPWDLFLPKPYRDGGQAVDAFNIDGLIAKTSLQGTLNDPRDRDRGWTVEIAIPWRALGDSGHNMVPPRIGKSWRVNFSRVEWDLDSSGGAYRKRVDRTTGKELPEHNWVWSPQGAINMHMPEMWGIASFGKTASPRRTDVEASWTLRRVYYAEREFQHANGRFSSSLDSLGLKNATRNVRLTTSASGWEAYLRAPTGVTWHIDAEGRLTHSP